MSHGPLSGVELNVPGDVVPFDGLLEFVAVHRKAAAQEYIFAKWIAKGKSKEFGRFDFIQALSRHDFIQVGAGILEGVCGDCSKPEQELDGRRLAES